MITLLPNQALAGVSVDPNSCGGDYIQPIQRGDVVSLQGYATQIGGNRSTALNLWTYGDGFVQDGALIRYGSSSMVTSATSDVLGLQRNRAYILIMSIHVIDSGTCGPGEGFIIKINDDFVKMPFTTLGDGSIQETELKVLYIPTTIASDKIEVTVNNFTFTFEVSNIFLVEYSYPEFDVYDSGGALIQKLGTVYTKFYEDTPSYNEQPIRWEAKLGFDAFANGCYSIKLRDGFGDVLNGNFINSNDWTVGAPWVISGGKATYNAIPINAGISTKFESLNGINQRLRFALSGDGSSIVATISFGGGGSVSQNFSGTGERTFDFVGTADLLATLTFKPNIGPAVAVNISVDNIIITATDIVNPMELFPVSLKTNWPNTLLFSATNNDSAFGFDYSDGFTQTLRMYSKIDITGYPEEAETYTYSDNSEAILFGRSQKEHTVFVGDAAEYMHDCLRILRLHDTFRVSGEDYVRSGEYGFNRRKTSALKQAIFTIKEKEGIPSNYRLS